MNNKEFIEWLRNFLSNINDKELEFFRDFPQTYNHSTILKTIIDKFKQSKL